MMPEMKRTAKRRLPCWIWPALVCSLALAGCESLNVSQRTPEEKAILDFSVQGLKMGQPRAVMAGYAEVEKIPGFPGGFEEFRIMNPVPQISMLVAMFRENSIRRLEIRYFNGPTTRSLARAGGWRGILEVLESRYGMPTETGPGVPVVAGQPGLNATYAKFNGVWKFPAVRRQLNFIAMEDSRGGVAIVTVSDTTPEIRRAAAVTRATPTPTPQLTAASTAPEPPEPVRPAPRSVIPDPGF